MEIVIALSILSVALLGFFQMFNTAVDSSYRATQENIAINLGRGLIAEIMSKNFADPQQPNNPLGLDTGEVALARNTFDDVDDYNGYSDGPPVAVGGAAMDGPNYSRFSRSVSVVCCDISGINIVNVACPSHYKRIMVTVSGPYVSNMSIEEIKAE